MLSTYVIVAIITAIISLLILRKLSKNRILISSLASVLVLLSLAMTYLYIVNCPFPKPTNSGAHSNTNSFLTLVAQQSPNEFNAYQDKIAINKKAGGDSHNDIYFSTELVNSLLLKYGAQASDQSLYDYLKQDIAFDKELYAINPELVLFHQYPERFEGKINLEELKKIAKDEYQTKILSYTQAVIKSGMQKEHELPSQTDIQKAKIIFAAIITNLGKKYGNDNVLATLKDPAGSGVDKMISANILIAFSEAILNTGPETTGLLLRVSYMQTNSSQR